MATELITYSNPGGESSNKAFASGLLTSDGSIVTILCGFVPTKIIITDYTGTNPDIITWVKGMAITAAHLLTGSTGVVTKGITGPYPYGDTEDDTWDGTGGDSTTDGHGFVIPAALLTDADTWMWEAYR